jgi:hypothetical protein
MSSKTLDKIQQGKSCIISPVQEIEDEQKGFFSDNQLKKSLAYTLPNKKNSKRFNSIVENILRSKDKLQPSLMENNATSEMKYNSKFDFDKIDADIVISKPEIPRERENANKIYGQNKGSKRDVNVSPNKLKNVKEINFNNSCNENFMPNLHNDSDHCQLKKTLENRYQENIEKELSTKINSLKNHTIDYKGINNDKHFLEETVSFKPLNNLRRTLFSEREKKLLKKEFTNENSSLLTKLEKKIRNNKLLEITKDKEESFSSKMNSNLSPIKQDSETRKFSDNHEIESFFDKNESFGKETCEIIKLKKVSEDNKVEVKSIENDKSREYDKESINNLLRGSTKFSNLNDSFSNYNSKESSLLLSSRREKLILTNNEELNYFNDDLKKSSRLSKMKDLKLSHDSKDIFNYKINQDFDDNLLLLNQNHLNKCVETPVFNNRNQIEISEKEIKLMQNFSEIHLIENINEKESIYNFIQTEKNSIEHDVYLQNHSKPKIEDFKQYAYQEYDNEILKESRINTSSGLFKNTFEISDKLNPYGYEMNINNKNSINNLSEQIGNKEDEHEKKEVKTSRNCLDSEELNSCITEKLVENNESQPVNYEKNKILIESFCNLSQKTSNTENDFTSYNLNKSLNNFKLNTIQHENIFNKEKYENSSIKDIEIPEKNYSHMNTLTSEEKLSSSSLRDSYIKQSKYLIDCPESNLVSEIVLKPNEILPQNKDANMKNIVISHSSVDPPKIEDENDFKIQIPKKKSTNEKRESNEILLLDNKLKEDMKNTEEEIKLNKLENLEKGCEDYNNPVRMVLNCSIDAEEKNDYLYSKQTENNNKSYLSLQFVKDNLIEDNHKTDEADINSSNNYFIELPEIKKKEEFTLGNKDENIIDLEFERRKKSFSEHSTRSNPKNNNVLKLKEFKEFFVDINTENFAPVSERLINDNDLSTNGINNEDKTVETIKKSRSENRHKIIEFNKIEKNGIYKKKDNFKRIKKKITKFNNSRDKIIENLENFKLNNVKEKLDTLFNRYMKQGNVSPKIKV